MQVNIRCKPSYSSAFCVLDHDEGLYVAFGAMMAMSSGFNVHTGIGSGGLGKAIKRRFLGGEPFLMARYDAVVDQAWIALSPRYPGDMEVLELNGDAWLLEAGSVLAAEVAINVDVNFAGIAMPLLNEGLTMLALSGQGGAIISAFGGMVPIDLGPDDVIAVDTGHLVGFTRGVSLKLGIVGSVVTTATSGEGLVASLHGPGRVLLQTRAEQSFRGWLDIPTFNEKRR